jgi:hypothetical protein
MLDQLRIQMGGSPADSFLDMLVPPGKRHFSRWIASAASITYYLFDSITEHGALGFFASIDQVALEMHISKKPGWMDEYKGGHVESWSTLCPHEPNGQVLRHQEIVEVGIECRPKTHRHNYLFGRPHPR